MIGIFMSVVMGIVFGIFFKNRFMLENIDTIINLGLCMLLFFVGMDMGKNNLSYNDVKKFGKRIWFLPFTSIIGSLLGGALSSFITTLTMEQGIVITSGMGWYSFSAIEISKVNAHLGSIAFLSNVFREFLAILLIPFIAKKIGYFESISATGAPAMDTLLPIINKYTSSDTAVVSFFSGAIISGLIPILVPSLIEILKI